SSRIRAGRKDRQARGASSGGIREQKSRRGKDGSARRAGERPENNRASGCEEDCAIAGTDGLSRRLANPDRSAARFPRRQITGDVIAVDPAMKPRMKKE